MRVLCVACALLVFLPLSNPPGPIKSERPVAETEVRAIAQAIEDEIYDYDQQGYFGDLGEPTRPARHQLMVYVEPSIRQGRAWIIYKRMPYGEVYRMFYPREDGLVVLHGDPENGFPPTQPDYLTVYMDDEELCKLKHEWLKHSFIIDLNPSEKRIRQAVENQKKRIGYSFHEDSAARAKSPGSSKEEAVLTPKAAREVESDPLARDTYQAGLRAALEADRSPDRTAGATGYVLDYGQRMPAWVRFTPPRTLRPSGRSRWTGPTSVDGLH